MASKNKCCIDGCSRKYFGLGFCATHYSQSKKGILGKIHRGSPNIIELHEDHAEIITRHMDGRESGRFMIDLDDVEKCSKYRWWNSLSYALSSSARQLHRFVIGAREGVMVDHINRNKFDNRKANLREVDKSLNSQNALLRGENSSGFTGVSLDKRRGTWMAYIKKNGKKMHLGGFKNKIDAALAYNSAAIAIYGENAMVNSI